jgi:putative SOS response-associated peptidase YedK
MGKPKSTRKPMVPAQKASPFDFKTAKPKHQVANARSKYVDVVKSRTAAVDAVRPALPFRSFFELTV